VHATVTGNVGMGVVRGPGHQGSLVNSIVRANGGPTQLTGFSPTSVRNSNVDAAFAGQNGNLAAPPLFVNVTQEDLALQPTSPCLGVAELAAANATLVDALEASRRLDHALSGTDLPDMGAYERPVFKLHISGQPQIGTMQVYSVSGPPGFVILFAGLLDGHASLSPFGFETVGQFANLIPVGPPSFAVGQPLALIVSGAPSLEGFRFGVQAIAFLASDPSKGQFTNRYRGRFYNP
ncbi:MAG: hypothetical protein KDB53_16165, partial [Planctomycetes bacterium]|nr:hypothetical protein [Planctomycetota bacterium]